MLTQGQGWTLINADCVEVLRKFGANRFDSVVTDPPYELGFMGKKWDGTGIAYSTDLWREVLRVLKPGGHMLAFGGTRTYHRMTCAIEDAGFEIRDCLAYMYGTGFPKSLNVGDGRGTALKPAHEPIVLARKPLEGTVAGNVARHGTGGLNIDACRIATPDGRPAYEYRHGPGGNTFSVGNAPDGSRSAPVVGSTSGRWPANVLLDETAAALLDAQSGVLKSGAHSVNEVRHTSKTKNAYGERIANPIGERAASEGGASRFFYCSKPSRAERDQGCEDLPARTGGEATDRVDGSIGTENPQAGAGRTGGARNYHPTVKPIALMRYLVRLVTPPGGIVLDPFVGSGTTGMAALAEGYSFLGIDSSADYLEIAKRRIASQIPDSVLQ